MWGDADWCARDAERVERERLHHEKQTAEADQVEALLAQEGTDRAVAQLLAMARLIDPTGWGMRASWLNMLERRRNGRKANDPGEVKHLERERNMAAHAITYGLNKAREAIALANTWKDEA